MVLGIDSESAIRLGCFAIVFAIMGLWELRWHLRDPMPYKLKRMRANFALLLVDVLVLRIIFPTAVVGVAVYATAKGIGLLNVVSLPFWVQIVLTVVALDLAVYGQHVTFHWLPMLWRLHRVHHTDLDLDLTTGFRFHPIEMVLSAMYKSALVLALGFPAIGILAFEVLLNATSVFNHSNARIPEPFESRLRKIIVTPAMHWVHHSVDPCESQRNFGFNLSWWDRLFGTYLQAPAAGIENMTLGVAGYAGYKTRSLKSLLGQPWTHAERDLGVSYELKTNSSTTD